MQLAEQKPYHPAFNPFQKSDRNGEAGEDHKKDDQKTIEGRSHQRRNCGDGGRLHKNARAF
jgi:hypothetical protein